MCASWTYYRTLELVGSRLIQDGEGPEGDLARRESSQVAASNRYVAMKGS